jgi:hypothetical protein
VESGIIKNVTTATVDTINYTTGAGRVAINDYVSGDNYLVALAQGTDITLTKASNVAANVISISANTSSIVNTAKSSLSVTGANISYDGAGAFTSTVGALTTTNVAEGSNLYYTDTRARSAISVSGDLAYNSSTGVISFTNDDGDISSVVAGTGLTGGATTGAATLNVIGGNGISVAADAITTDDTYIKGLFSASGTTLSYSNGAFTSTADNYGSWSFTTDSSGNEAVSSAELVSFVGGSNMDVTHSGSTITIATNADITGVIAGTGLSGGGTSGDVTLNVSGLTVAELAAGSLQLGSESFTDNDTSLMTSAAIQDKIEAYGYGIGGGDITSVVAGTGLTGGATAGDATVNVIGGDGITANANDIAIDYSDTWKGHIIPDGNATRDLGNASNKIRHLFLSDNSLTLGNFTLSSPADVLKWNEVNVAIAGEEGHFTTAQIAEGTNKYFTDSRARTAISVSGDLAYNSSTGVISFTNDAGDIEGVTAGTGLSGGGTSGTVTLNLDFTDFDTGDITENTNLYFTNARADARITNALIDEDSFATNSATKLPSQQSVKAYVDAQIDTADHLSELGGDTDDVTEGSSNLYFTNARADARITKAAIDALNVDADTLDGIDSASFLRSDAADSHSGDIAPSTNNTINLGSASNKYATVYATTFNGVATTAQYADLAENYVADADYPIGTVVVLGGEQEITVTSESNSSKVAGVVSTDPAYLMNSGLSGQFVKAVALRGRVPVRVVGVVNKGDVLVTSTTPGVAMVGSDPHFIGAACVIGKSISNKEHAGEGIVEVLV